MSNPRLTLLRLYLPLLLQYGASLLSQRFYAALHRLTYRNLPTSAPQNVIVIGASYAGTQLASRLSESLPSGFRVILLEKHTSFHHLFNFPRYSVMRTKGREKFAFIPYTRLCASAPSGIFSFESEEVTRIGEREVELASGDSIPFAFAAIATGATFSGPAGVESVRKEDACKELTDLQDEVERAQKIAVLGAGAVGVQTAGDVGSFYPGKEVWIVHSRERLLTSFGKKLSEYVVVKLEALGVKVVLGERPVLEKSSVLGGADLVFKDGRRENFDLVIPCTGQSPNSSLVTSLSPSSISSKTGRILVNPTLQIKSPDKKLNHIFALGDVAETGGPKMARAALVQAEIVRSNILASIKGTTLQTYTPRPVEGALKLTLGKDEMVGYVQNQDGSEILVPGKSKGVDLDVAQMWKRLGQKFDEDH